MTVTNRTLVISATLVLLAGVCLGWALVGVDFAQGVALSGTLMLVNLLFWGVLVGRMIRGAQGHSSKLGQAVTLALMGFKYMVLMVGLFALVHTFDAVPVLLGCSVIVVVVMGLALIGVFRELRVGVPLDGNGPAPQEGC